MNSNPATILVFGGGIGGGDCTHNGMYDIALISSIPNIIGLAPATKEEYFAALDWAIEQNSSPVVIRVPKAVIGNGEKITLYEKTAVKFFDLTDDEISAYVATGECSDKAGAYGIQGKGSLLVEKITGDYFNVVGLPVARLYRELRF